jgi:hypothetical protein
MPQPLGQPSMSVEVCDCMVSRWLRSRLGDVTRTVLFFGLLYLYLWLVVKPCLIYSCGTITNFPIFYKGWAFFQDSVSSPGGLLRYISSLASQLFYYSWAGAIVITVQAWAISACTGWFLRAVAMPGARWLRFVPALLVLAIYAQYTYHLPLIMGALAALFAACLYVRLVADAKIADCGLRIAESGRSIHAQSRSVAVFVALSVVIYVVAAAAFLPFAATCGAYEFLHRRRYGIGVAYLVFAAIAPYVAGVLLFRVSIIDAYTDGLPLSWRIRGWRSREQMVAAVYALYLFPVAGALVGGLRRIIADCRSAATTDAKGTSAPTHGRARPAKPAKALLPRLRRWVGAPAVTGTVGSLLVLAAAGVVAFVSLDRRQQTRLEVHYYACQRMWPQVLQAARRDPADQFVMNAVDRALWHTGRFTQDMFSYPQHADALLLTGEDHVLVYWNKFDTQIDLGLMNVAEKNLTECMETFGEQPMILQRLAMVNMVKGSMDTARIYLGALTKTLFHGRWAKDYLARLETDPTLAGDREIQDLRSRCLKTDATALFYAKEEMLATLAAQDNHNRMAFEYLMAWYVQTKQLDKFVRNIGRLGEFGYTTIPPLYQEALAIYAYPRNKAGEYPISPEVRSRFENFSRIFNKYKRDKAAAMSELAASYRDSYLFYYIYAF